MRSDFPYALLLAFVVGIAGCADTTVTTNDAEKPKATPTAFNTVGAPTIQFSVPDMMCEDSCAVAVHDTLAAQPGAVEVQVDFPNRLATVAIEEGKFDSQAALAALLDKQFTEAKLVGAEEETAK
jgi:copper chaperone CopZ